MPKNGKNVRMPYPTIGAARQAVVAAREKLVTLKKPRQAAEDAWIGAVTVVRAALRCNGKDWHSTKGVMPRFREFLKASKSPMTLADDLSFLAGSLHGSCFYAGVPEACDVNAVEGGIRAVERFIQDASVYCKRAR